MAKNARRWIVFLVLCLAYMPGAYAQYQLSVFAPELMSQFNLSTSQFSSIFTSPMIIAVLLSFVGGMISDRFGPKKVVAIAFAITCIGLIGRVFSISYGTFFLCMVLVGASQTAVNANASKLTGSWFQAAMIGILMGAFTLSGQLASTLATATSAAWFASMQDAYVAAAVFGVIVLVLWLVFVKDSPESKGPSLEPSANDGVAMRDCLRVVLRNRGVWMIAVCIMMDLGCTVALASFLPTALQQMYGIELSTAGTIAAMLTMGNCIGAIAGPIAFKQMRGNAKRFVPATAALSFAGVLLCWRFASIPVLYALILLTGTALGAAMPIFFSAPILLDGIGTKYAGSATGVIATLQMLGAIVIPTYILAPIAGDNYGLMFTLASVCMVVMFVFGLFIPELKAGNEGR